jgi:hypothetical protein
MKSSASGEKQSQEIVGGTPRMSQQGTLHVPETVIAGEGIPDDPLTTSIYTPIESAQIEIWKRFHDEAFKKEVEKFLGNDLPEFLTGDPKIVLGRCVASPNREAIHFLQIARQMDLHPIFAEYSHDKFIPENADKYYLGKLFFYNGKGRNGGRRISSFDAIHLSKEDGSIISDIQTVWNEPFVDFHHRMFRDIVCEQQKFFDISAWLARHGGKAKDYYLHYLALFLCHSVLAEVFLVYDRKEKGFIEDTFYPAFTELEARFGVKPLVIPMFHSKEKIETMNNDGTHWMQYPENAKRFLERLV